MQKADTARKCVILSIFLHTHPNLLWGLQWHRLDQAEVEGGREDEDEHRGSRGACNRVEKILSQSGDSN